MMEWKDQERIRMAIVTIHAEGRYYDGMDRLCELVGWKSFRFEGGFLPSEAMDAWVRSKGGGQGAKGETAPDRVDGQSAIEILQGAISVDCPVDPLPKRKGGWPKGKLRGPRKPKAEVIPIRCEAK